MISIRAQIRRYSIKAPFPPNRNGTGPVAFEKNMPMQLKLKAWEKDGEDKESWFKRKHAHHHAAQKRYKEERGIPDYTRRKPVQKERKPLKTILRSFSKDPLIDYVHGTNPVLAALKASTREFGKLYIHSPVAVSAHNAKDVTKLTEIKNLAKQHHISIIDKGKMELNEMTNNGVHNGVVLECRKIDTPIAECLSSNFTREMFSYESVLNGYEEVFPDSYKGTRYPLALYLDELTDPHNVGAILRTAYFLGVDMVFLSERNCAPLNPVVDKVSAGAMEFMNIANVAKPLDFISKSSENGWGVVATDMPGTKKSPRQMSISDVREMLNHKPVLLLIGSEGQGVRKTLVQRSEGVLGISSGRDVGCVDSLNVSVATGLLLGGLLSS